MEWKIGQVPQHVFKDARMSAQDRRTAQIATYVHERAEEQRKDEQRKEEQHAQTVAQSNHLPLAGGGSAPIPRQSIASRRLATRTESERPRDLIKHPLSETEELRLSVMRKLMAVIGHRKECPARMCRRYRRCASPAHECAKLTARKQRSPEQEQAAMAYLKRTIARRKAELNGAEQT